MKNSLIGILLSFQFFTSIPIRKQLPMHQRSVTAMFAVLPVVSILMGFLNVAILLVNEYYLQFSVGLVAILVVVANIVMTGGLHLDGWIDMSDAYFSYQNQSRRLEILEDSRIGAFGAISLVVLLLLKVGFIFEVLAKNGTEVFFYFVAIPFLSRIALLLYFLSTKNAKESGLAVYFKAQVNGKVVWIFLLFYTLLLYIYIYFFNNIQVIILFFCMISFVTIFRLWSKKNFGGMTGDLLGASYEVVEVFLWGILIFLI